jgi:hypothetical protein
MAIMPALGLLIGQWVGVLLPLGAVLKLPLSRTRKSRPLCTTCVDSA